VPYAVVEAVVGLKVRVASVPFWVSIPLGSGIRQEIMCLSRINADRLPCEKNVEEGAEEKKLLFRLQVFTLRYGIYMENVTMKHD